MYQKEPLPSYLQKLIGVGYRVVIGAVLGLVCAVAILVVRALFWGDVSIDNNVWEAAFLRGAALFGAIYYPLAWPTLLEKEDKVTATSAVSLVSIAFGVLGFGLSGPGSTAIAASVGFWGSCAAIYQRRKRDRNRSDFGSYFR